MKTTLSKKEREQRKKETQLWIEKIRKVRIKIKGFNSVKFIHANR